MKCCRSAFFLAMHICELHLRRSYCKFSFPLIHRGSTSPHLSYSIDKSDYFRNPVSKSDVPDYFEIIKNPICWTEIEAKLDNHQYWDLQAFVVCFYNLALMVLANIPTLGFFALT